ncbi:zinc-ribbon domain-containing protein [Lachnoclostridium phytofermentans]|uniref:Zinc-ribbon domain-containing protein n=1 Tax=Lachnoclostridium phytofermentans (strain ATCC 700394 / DSM 18823 / ISDg) TaxID=357809 RepID=A9KRX3_LACP7|nr:zinc-ribbon domain-containing protein [Lachnoclostridium phytofermentans]ABX40604.1 hypothetical protein Cphy_0217 [Lachnoclostridium phytofermentans ISDg]
MVCKICGRTIQNEEANFCEYCGAPFRPGMDNRVLENEHSSSPNVYGQDITMQQRLGQGSASQNGPWQTNYEQSAYGNSSMKDQVLGRFTNQDSNTNAQGSAVVQEKPMSVGKWLAVMMLGFIPPIGPYAFLILLFYWSFSKSIPLTRKNWARATLIVALVLVIFLFAAIGMTGGEILSDPTAILNSIYGK